MNNNEETKRLEIARIDQLLRESKFDHAIAATEKSTSLDEASKNAIVGTIYTKQENLSKAEIYFLRALNQQSNHPIANGNYARLLILQKKLKQAMPFATIAYKASPKDENFALNYTACLADSERLKEAIETIRPFWTKTSPKKNIAITLSSLLRSNLQPDEALDVLNDAQSVYKDDPELDRALADCYSEMDPYIAREYFQKSVTRLKDSIALMWNWSFVELRLRNFSKGWELYENGLSEKIGKIGRPLPAQVKLLPIITDIKKIDPAKWTFLTTEQGIGDQVLFLGCLSDFLAGRHKIALIGEERMLPILKRSYPEIDVFPYAMANVFSNRLSGTNGIFPIGSLQKYYRTETSDFKKTQFPYLKNDVVKTKKYRELFQSRYKQKKIVGISWRGGHWDRQQRTKSFSFLEFSKLLSKDDVHYVCLQYGDVSEAKTTAMDLGIKISFISDIDFRKDLDSWFSLICACDEVISVSTAMVHFAGAADIPVKLILSEYQSPFIWGIEEGVSIVYPKTYVYRKGKSEALDAYFERVKNESI